MDDSAKVAHPVTPETSFASNPARWRCVEHTGPDAVFENLAARPRAWIAHHVIPSTASESLDAVRENRHRNGTVLAEGAQALDTVARPSAEMVRLVRVDPLLMELEVSCQTPCFLVTSDTLYPGWAATIDGKQETIHPADFGLRGIAVPSGHHRILFAYRPAAIAVGASVSAVALLAICTALAVSRRRATG